MSKIDEAKHELDALIIPDTQVFSDLAGHFQDWGTQHQDFLQQLDAGHTALRENWLGDGADAYTTLHGQSQQTGNQHVEYMQKTTTGLHTTVDLVSHASHLKSTAHRALTAIIVIAVVTLGLALIGVLEAVAAAVLAVASATTFFATLFGGIFLISWLIPSAPPTPFSISSLTNTAIFAAGAIGHIFLGDLKNVYKKGVWTGKTVLTGFHYAGSAIGGVVGHIGSILSTNPDGVYTAVVNGGPGVPKQGNGGVSTFFPNSMSPQDVVDAINTAYNNRGSLVPGTKNTYEYTFPAGSKYAGMVIQMYLNAANQIISAFPTK